MKKSSLFFLAALFAISLYAQPVINSFSPSSGPIGTIVAINGTGFSTTPANNIVFFGSTKAVVNASSTTSLSVTVPAGAAFEPITVTTNQLTAWSLQPFMVTFTGGGAAFSASSYAARVDFTTGLDPRGFSVMDLDGDNKPEVVVANFSGGSISIFRNIGTNGNLAFAPKMDILTGAGGDFDEPYFLTYTDVDGDGKMDIVVSCYGIWVLQVYKNTSTIGSLSFNAPLVLPVGNGNPNFVVAGDLDNDGRPELLTSSTAPMNRLSIFRNTTTNGVLSFGPEIDYTESANAGHVYSFGIALSDLDSDGKLDVTVANAGAGTISIFKNITVGNNISLAPKVSYNTRLDPTKENFPYHVSTGDIDGDGKQDIIVANSGNGNGSNEHLSVFRNLSTPGDIILSSRVDFGFGVPAPYTLSVSDLNGDGKLDVHTGSSGLNTVSLFKNTSTPGNISFDAHVDFASPLSARSTTADLTGDGKPEMITINAGTNTMSVYKSQVPNPPPPPPTCNSFSPHHGHHGSSVTITGNNFHPDRNRNTVHFGGARATVTAATATTLTVLVPTGGIYEPITVTTNDRTAYSDQPFSVTFTGGGNINSTSFGTHTDFTASANAVSAAMGDLDGDNKPDLAVANKNANTVSVFLNTSNSTGNFSFATKVDFATGAGPVSVSIGDYDGDGKPDLAIANKDANTVSVLRNTGITGLISFGAKLDYATGSNPVSVATGDVNGDGKPDLVIANNGAATVSVIRNNSATTGDLSFAAKADFAAGTNPSFVSVADLNGDAKGDIAVTNSGANTVSVLRNNGSGTTVSFSAKVDFATVTNPASIAMGDLDLDGKTDLVVTNAGSASVSLFRNTSSGSTIAFAVRIDKGVGANPVSVSTANLDGDEKPDLVIANAGANTLTVLRNTTSGIGSISFGANVDFVTAADPRSLATGDLDGDGKTDLAIANGTSNTFSVFNNRVDLSLPVSLVRFSGRNSGNNNFLDWETASEQHLRHFALERSTDGANYTPAAVINATGAGNSSTKYNYTDAVGNVNAPVWYYRLKMVDIDGKFTYSAIVKIRMKSSGLLAELAANPVEHRLAINIELSKEEKVMVTMTDMSGKNIMKRNYLLNKGNNAVEINGLENLAKGMYLLQVRASGQQQTLKVIKK